MYVLTENYTVLLGEINMLENAVRRRHSTGCHKKPVAQTVFVQPDDFAGFDLTDELGVYCVQSAALAGNNVSAFFGLADAQRPDAERVSRRLNPVSVQKQKTVRPLQMI